MTAGLLWASFHVGAAVLHSDTHSKRRCSMKVLDTCKETRATEKAFTFADTKPGDVFESGSYVYLRVCDGWGYITNASRENLAMSIRGPNGPGPYNIVRFSDDRMFVTLLPNAALILKPERLGVL